MKTKFYAPREVADMLRLEVNTIYQYVRLGKLQAVRIENRYQIAETEVKRFAEYQESIMHERNHVRKHLNQIQKMINRRNI